MSEAMLTLDKIVALTEDSAKDKEALLSLEIRADGQLWTRLNGKSQSVTIQRCFPWSDPLRYVSLRDHDGNEVALVSRIEELDSGSRAALAGVLAESGFAFEIDGVYHVEEDFEVRSWHVSTRQGSRRFQTKLDEWPLHLAGGGWLISDVAGDLFVIRDPGTLDSRSRKLLDVFIG